MMSDDELARYLGIERAKDRAKILAALTPKERAGYERMRDVELGIKLWLDGLAPRPPGIICCRRNAQRKRGIAGE